MIRASQALFWFGLIITASVGLYHTSDRVHELNQQLHDLNAGIETEQKTIHVLKAEWVYLANPARVETATRKYLPQMHPASPQQVSSMNELAERLPTRVEAMASVSVTTAPIANVKTSMIVPAVHVAAQQKPSVATVASADTTHVNNHLTMIHTASAQPAPDSIGMLLADLGSHP